MQDQKLTLSNNSTNDRIRKTSTSQEVQIAITFQTSGAEVENLYHCHRKYYQGLNVHPDPTGRGKVSAKIGFPCGGEDARGGCS